MKTKLILLVWLITQRMVLAGVESDLEWSRLTKELEQEVAISSQTLEPPVKSYNSKILCNEVQKVFKPSTSGELVDAIQFAIQNRLRVRTVGELHSVNTLICTDGVMISTENLNKIKGIEIFKGEETVLAEPGVKLGELSEWLHERDRSLGYALINYRGVSLGGAVATGSHGDSAKHPVVLASLVQSFKIVTGTGEIREYSSDNTPPEQFKALRTNLGLMGSVFELRLKIEPQFNIKTENSIHGEKPLFEKGGIVSVISECDFGDIRWFPHTHKFHKTCGIRTSEKADPSATNTSLSPKTPKFLMKPMKDLFQFGARHKKVNVLLEKIRLAELRLVPPFSRINRFGKLVHKNHVIGYSHRIMTSDLSEQLREIPTTSWEVAVPLSKSLEALTVIRALVQEKSISLPFSGITIRYAPVTDDTLIAINSAGGDFRVGDPAIIICMIVYDPVGFSAEEYHQYLKPYRELVELLIKDMSGRAHWGKNELDVFRIQNGSNGFGDLLTIFKSIVTGFDPAGIFRNDFTAIAGVSRP